MIIGVALAGLGVRGEPRPDLLDWLSQNVISETRRKILGRPEIHSLIENYEIEASNMFLGGVVLSLSYYLSGEKLWVPIGFHFGWNIMGYLLFASSPRWEAFAVSFIFISFLHSEFVD